MIKYKSNFKANNRAYLQIQINERYDQGNDESYPFQEDYFKTIDRIRFGLEDKNFNLIYELLELKFRTIFEQCAEKIPIEYLRIFEVIQLLIEVLQNYLSDDFNQFFLKSIFQTFNHVLNHSKASHPFQLFVESDFFLTLLDITSQAEDNLLREIIIFMRTILDETQDYLDLAFQIINLHIFKELIIPTLNNGFDEKTYIEYVHLIFELSKQPYLEIEGLDENIFSNAVVFIEFPNIEAIKNGYNIISNLTDSDNENIKVLVEQSTNLSQCIKRHLDIDFDESILIWIIKSLGNMCHWNYNLNLYNINPLIQFLDYENVNIINLTSYALCNALKDINKSQFSQEDCLNIFNKLCELMQNSCFGLSSYVGQTIPKIFKVIPCQYYQDIVQNGVFNIFQQIATIDTLMISNAKVFFDAIDQLFFYAESNQLLEEFTQAFMDSECYSTLADFEITDDMSNADEIRERISSLLDKFDRMLGHQL